MNIYLFIDHFDRTNTRNNFKLVFAHLGYPQNNKVFKLKKIARKKYIISLGK